MTVAANAVPAKKPATMRMLAAPVILAASLLALGGGIYYTISTKPKFDVGALLNEAAEMTEHGEFQKAIDHLNTNVVPIVNAGLSTETEIGAFFMYRGRALYEAAAAEGIRREENFKAVLADYASAKKYGVKLDTSDVIRAAMSKLGLGKVDEALKDADSLPSSEAESRKKIVKLVVADGLKEPKKHFERTLGLLVELSQEPGISGDEASWALARQGELLIGAGRGKEAIVKMLREMQLVKGLSAAQEAEMSELLGRAYAAEGEVAEAARQFERAMSLAEPATELRASAMVQLGQMRQATGQLDEAKELFTTAMEHVSGTEAYLSALVGRASVLASQGNDEEAMRDYSELIEKLPKETSEGLTPEAIAEGLMVQQAERLTVGKTRAALRYAVLAESLFAKDKTPSGILLSVAASNRQLADELMGRVARAKDSNVVAGSAEVDSTQDRSAKVDAVTHEEAKRCYLAAGVNYARHAAEIVVEDAESATRSRWMSADSFDLAGDMEEATRAFSAYLQGAPGQDPRRQEAKYRLARVFQATGDFGTAAALYRELLEERGAATDRGGMVWADRSIVPLAQCYLADGDAGNDADAERELLALLDGRDFMPQAEEFRQALMELGRWYYESGRYEQAIERLREFETRFPQDAGIGRTRFRLADSQRLSAGAIDKTLQQAMPQAQREELQTTKKKRLRDAMSLFERVKAGYASVAPETIGPVERVYLRNSTFYLGDCAYELGEYDTAIGYYDSARQRYDADPASLVALVQIVNAYVHQGQWAKAVTANERARQHLAKFPESVWSDPDLPMDKRHWERWLDSRSLLEQHARVGSGQ